MKSGIVLLLLLLGGLAFHCDTNKIDEVSPVRDVLTLITQVPLPEVTGRIDHIAFDAAHHLALIAALGNNSVEVVNIVTKQVIHSIKKLHAPQGIIYIPSSNRLVVANDDNGEVDFFDMTNYKMLASINLKDDADNVRYDADKNLVYVGYAEGAIAIIDANSMKEIASIKLDGHPESFQISKKQNRLYINVPDANEIEVADLATRSVIAKWKNIIASANFPMALDEENNRLFIACRSPGTLRMLNTQTGKDIQSISCSGDADDVFYDAADSLTFVSAGKGFIDVFKVSNQLEHINHILTSSGARTSLLLPREKKLLLAVPERASKPAALWVYDLE